MNQTVAPGPPSACQRASRVISPGCQTTLAEREARQRPSSIIPAPTVSLVASSMRMNEPVVRLSA